MSNSKDQKQKGNQEFDPAAYEKQKKNLMKFYDEEIPFLEKKAKYESLLTEIEVAEMTRIEIMMRKGQMMESQRQAEKEAKESLSKETAKTLKKQ